MVRINTDMLLAAVARLLIGWWPLKRQYSEGESWDEGIQFYSRASTLKNGPGTESKPTPKKIQSISGNSKVKNLKAFLGKGRRDCVHWVTRLCVGLVFAVQDACLFFSIPLAGTRNQY